MFQIPLSSPNVAGLLKKFPRFHPLLLEKRGTDEVSEEARMRKWTECVSELEIMWLAVLLSQHNSVTYLWIMVGVGGETGPSSLCDKELN